MESTSVISIALGAILLYKNSNNIALDELDPIKLGMAKMVSVIDVPQFGWPAWMIKPVFGFTPPQKLSGI